MDDQLVQYSSGSVFCKWILSIQYDLEVTNFYPKWPQESHIFWQSPFMIYTVYHLVWKKLKKAIYMMISIITLQEKEKRKMKTEITMSTIIDQQYLVEILDYPMEVRVLVVMLADLSSRPPRTEFVRPFTCAKLFWSVVRIRPSGLWPGLKFPSAVHMDEGTGGPSANGRREVFSRGVVQADISKWNIKWCCAIPKSEKLKNIKNVKENIRISIEWLCQKIGDRLVSNDEAREKVSDQAWLRGGKCNWKDRVVEKFYARKGNLTKSNVKSGDFIFSKSFSEVVLTLVLW